MGTDVENLGGLGDVVEVKPVDGRNFLLPQGYAVLATPSNLKVFGLERKKLQERTGAQRSAASSLASQINSTPITITMRVGDNDKLYGSVTTALIADALEAKGIEIDRRRIPLDAPIRGLGDYTVRVRLHANVVAELPPSVVAEKTHHEEDTETLESITVSQESEEPPPAQAQSAE